MSLGEMMYYGGMVGIGVCLLAGLLCIKVFPKQRKKMLEKLGEDK